MWLNMAEKATGGTQVSYDIDLYASRIALPGPLAAVEYLVLEHAGTFAVKYKNNILKKIPDSKKLFKPGAATT